MTLTTKDADDNKLLDEIIRENGKLKQKLTTRLPKLIIYNVAKDTTEDEVKDAIENQNDVPNRDDKILIKMERKNGTHWVEETYPETLQYFKSKRCIYIEGKRSHVR